MGYPPEAECKDSWSLEQLVARRLLSDKSPIKSEEALFVDSSECLRHFLALREHEFRVL